MAFSSLSPKARGMGPIELQDGEVSPELVQDKFTTGGDKNYKSW
jgi:hypothetical protein